MATVFGTTWERLIFQQHGVVSRAQVLEFMTPRVAGRHLSSGRWRAAARGVYLTHTGPLDESARLWVASLAAGRGQPAASAGVSALSVLGLRRLRSHEVHVLVPLSRQVRNPPEYVRIHRTGDLPAGDLNTAAGPPCTTAPRSVVDAAAWARTEREARTIIAMAFQQRLVRGDQIAVALDGRPVVPRRALIMRTAQDARDGSESVSELDLVELCRAQGLPVPTRQVVRAD